MLILTLSRLDENGVVIKDPKKFPGKSEWAKDKSRLFSLFSERASDNSCVWERVPIEEVQLEWNFKVSELI